MEDIYRYEFTSEEVNSLVVGLICSKINDEQYIKNYSAYADSEIIKTCIRNVQRCERLLDKLRRDYK